MGLVGKLMGNVTLPGGSTLSKSYILIATIIAWIIYGSMLELHVADTTCCKKGGCGTGQFDRFSYWSTLTIGVVGTLILAWPLISALTDIIFSFLSKL